MSVDLNGALAFTIVGDLIVIAGTVGRFYMLGGQARSRAKLASDVFFLCFSVLVLANSGGMYRIYTKELTLRNSEGFEKMAQTVVDVQYLKIVFSVSFLYIVQVWSLKAAFLSLFYDLSRYLSTSLRRLLFATMTFVGATFLMNILFQLLKCRPLDTNWSLDPSTSCAVMLSVPGVIVTSWSNILSDLTILIMGISLIRNLKVKKNERGALMLVALIGSVSIVATIIRFVFCYRVARANEAEFLLVHEIFTWSSIEIVLAFAAFCLPAFKALLNRREDDKTKRSAALSKRSILSTLRGGRRSNRPRGETVLSTFDSRSGPNGSEVELKPANVEVSQVN